MNLWEPQLPVFINSAVFYMQSVEWKYKLTYFSEQILFESAV